MTKELAKKTIIVIGQRELVYGFKALGIETACVETPEEADKILARKNADIFFVVEHLLTRQSLEANAGTGSVIIPIPGIESEPNIGIEKLKELAEKAVGSSILES